MVKNRQEDTGADMVSAVLSYADKSRQNAEYRNLAGTPKYSTFQFLLEIGCNGFFLC